MLTQKGTKGVPGISRQAAKEKENRKGIAVQFLPQPML